MSEVSDILIVGAGAKATAIATKVARDQPARPRPRCG